jgi:hypothetical protein
VVIIIIIIIIIIRVLASDRPLTVVSKELVYVINGSAQTVVTRQIPAPHYTM